MVANLPLPTSQSARVLAEGLLRDRDVLVGAMRRQFASAMPPGHTGLAAWRVGIVWQRPPWNARQRAGGAYLLYSGDFWLREPESIARLLAIVKGTTDGTLDDRAARAARNFVGHGLDAAFASTCRFRDEARRMINTTLEELIAHAGAREFVPTSQRLSTIRARARSLSSAIPPELPEDDVPWRLLAPPFSTSGGPALTNDEDARVWLAVEGVLAALLERTPQVGGYGGTALTTGQLVAAPFAQREDARTPEEAGLRALETILFPPQEEPYFVACPVKGRCFGKRGGKPIAYCYAVSERKSEQAENDVVTEVMRRVVTSLRDSLRAWLDKDFAVALASAQDWDEQREIVSAHIDGVTGGLDVRVVDAEAPAKESHIRTVLKGPCGDLEIAIPKSLKRAARERVSLHLQLLASTAATSAQLSRGAVLDATAEVGFLTAHDISNFLDEIPTSYLTRAAAELTRAADERVASLARNRGAGRGHR